MALQTANQFRLNPNIASNLGGGVQTGQNIAGQFQLGKQRDQQIQQTEEDATVKRFLNSALELSTVPDNQKLSALRKNKAEILARGGETSDTDAGIALAESGDFETLNNEIQGIITNGERRGLIKPLAVIKKAPGFTLGNQRFSADGKLIATGEEKPPATTSLEKNLIAAGFTPGTEEFQAEILKNINKPTGTQITIGGEKKFQEEVQKGQAATFAKVGEQADSAIDANESLSLLESIDVNTGSLEPAKQALATFASGFGIDASGLANISKGEAFNSIAKRIVLDVKSTQKGPQTETDAVTIRKTIASLGNTKGGNQFIIDSARALNNRRIERKEFYDKFIEDSGGNFKDESGQTADRAWSKFKRNTPLVSSTQKTPEGLPVFFYKFEKAVRGANPDASRAEIIEAWKTKNKGVK